MITFFPDNVWLAAAILVGIVIATATVSALSTLRWGRKAWPLVLGAALAIPTIIAVVLMVGLSLAADRTGTSGYSIHVRPLGLIGIGSALLGSGLAMARRWSKVC